MSNEFVGHPLLDESSEGKIDINQIFEKNKALISIFPGSRTSEIDVAYTLRFYKINEQKLSRFYLYISFYKTTL